MHHNELVKEIGPTFSRNTISQSDTELDASEIFAPEPLLECITPRRKHTKTVKTGTEVFVSYDTVADPAVVGNEVRTKSSAAHTVGFLSTIIERQKAKTGYQFWFLDMTLTNCLVLQLFPLNATKQLEN